MHFTYKCRTDIILSNQFRYRACFHNFRKASVFQNTYCFKNVVTFNGQQVRGSLYNGLQVRGFFNRGPYQYSCLQTGTFSYLRLASLIRCSSYLNLSAAMHIPKSMYRDLKLINVYITMDPAQAQFICVAICLRDMWQVRTDLDGFKVAT